MSDGEPQGRLFDPDRYSIVGAGVYLLLPKGSARAHVIAAAYGRAHRRDSSFAPLRSGKDADCVVIEKPQRKFILTMLGIHRSKFDRYIKEWVDLNVAHRCTRGVLCLWLKPLEDPCPYCKQECPIQGDKKGTDMATSSTGYGDKSVPTAGDASGMKKGMDGLKRVLEERHATADALEDPDIHEEGSEKSRREREEKRRRDVLKALEDTPGYRAEVEARRER
jgi:hypothetical protein